MKGMVQNMQNYVDGKEIPMGLGMALAQNLDAMNRFSSLEHEQQQEIINHTHDIQSKNEMKQFVSTIAEGSNFK